MFNELNEEAKLQISNLVPMIVVDLDDSVKYLGFKL